MNLLETLLNASNGGAVREIARSAGLNEADATKAITGLLPALSKGISRNAAQPGGLDSLLGALKGGSHNQYADNPESLGRPESISDGNAILGHILGSKDVSRNVAGHAAAETGLDAGVLKQLLPMVAAAAMGSLGKQASSGGGMNLAGGGASGIAGMLQGFLDSDGDGSVADDLLSLSKKFF